jgi:hypothetical protein
MNDTEFKNNKGTNCVPSRDAVEATYEHEEKNDIRYREARTASPATAVFHGQDAGSPAVAVLEQIYRDMISALQQMYRDTIAAKDDALAGRDRELETKDALIEHLRRRTEESEARSSQALRYIGEMDQIEEKAAISRQARKDDPHTNEPPRSGFWRQLFGV